ncbi:hypothetical protein [Streptomyces turgidiscabies]|uniref:Lipoprotein n=1 Tax=Streptomyces turgidiscabies TaxID=85558 RepID=A0ABU0RTS3_9ACTN|nr:hypothetical protein [Streptomyces turgidiscabies]MDQ0934532.1 hypothetical protein [Streptomyces turgidiscabies]
MRIRATVAAVTGALALSALAVPAAQAAPAPNVTFTKVTVNNGKPIVARAAGTTSVPVTYTFRHTRGLSINPNHFASGPVLYLGRTIDMAKVFVGDEPGTCTATSSTVAKCKGFIDLHTSGETSRLLNTSARKWNVGAIAITDSGYFRKQGGLGTSQIKFHSKLTATDATPEAVKAGETLTVKASLSRANWRTNGYDGYPNVPVALQFKKAGAATFTTVKTVNTDRRGALTTTVKASVDGMYRYSFAGSTNTAPVAATGDYIDVQ